MKIVVTGVLRPMEDAAGARFAMTNEYFRGSMLYVTSKLLREYPDENPERFHVYRILMGFFDLAAESELRKSWAEA